MRNIFDDLKYDNRSKFHMRLNYEELSYRMVMHGLIPFPIDLHNVNGKPDISGYISKVRSDMLVINLFIEVCKQLDNQL